MVELAGMDYMDYMDYMVVAYMEYTEHMVARGASCILHGTPHHQALLKVFLLQLAYHNDHTVASFQSQFLLCR